MQLSQNMELICIVIKILKYFAKKKLTIESAHETSTFIIEIIVGKF